MTTEVPDHRFMPLLLARCLHDKGSGTSGRQHQGGDYIATETSRRDRVHVHFCVAPQSGEGRRVAKSADANETVRTLSPRLGKNVHVADNSSGGTLNDIVLAALATGVIHGIQQVLLQTGTYRNRRQHLHGLAISIVESDHPPNQASPEEDGSFDTVGQKPLDTDNLWINSRRRSAR
jgi:hypothetical protein